MGKRNARLWALAEFLDRRNPAASEIWGPLGIYDPLAAGDIYPVPLTFKLLWRRRGERRLFRSTAYDLVD